MNYPNNYDLGMVIRKLYYDTEKMLENESIKASRPK